MVGGHEPQPKSRPFVGLRHESSSTQCAQTLSNAWRPFRPVFRSLSAPNRARAWPDNNRISNLNTNVLPRLDEFPEQIKQ